MVPRARLQAACRGVDVVDSTRLDDDLTRRVDGQVSASLSPPPASASLLRRPCPLGMARATTRQSWPHEPCGSQARPQRSAGPARLDRSAACRARSSRRQDAKASRTASVQHGSGAEASTGSPRGQGRPVGDGQGGGPNSAGSSRKRRREASPPAPPSVLRGELAPARSPLSTTPAPAGRPSRPDAAASWWPLPRPAARVFLRRCLLRRSACGRACAWPTPRSRRPRR